MIQLLLTECLRADNMDAISFRGTDQSQRCARTAAGVFDHGSSRRQPAVLPGAGNHGKRHAIFHASGRILPFKLGKYFSAVWRDNMMKLNERSIPNRVENVAVGVHLPLMSAATSGLESQKAIPSPARAGQSTDAEREVSQASELKRQRDPR